MMNRNIYMRIGFGVVVLSLACLIYANHSYAD